MGTVSQPSMNLSQLEKEIQWNYEHCAQKMAELRLKLIARKNLYTSFRVHFLCDLYVVGSSVSGLAVTTSDTDMCLILADYPSEKVEHGDAIHILEHVLKIIKKTGLYSNLELIRATVPLLKFQEIATGIKVDLNIGNAVGIRNTHLIKCYADSDLRVAPLVLAVKKWASSHEINNAHRKTISSYSWTLMVIHFFQYGVKGDPVLPCLQKLHPDLFNELADIRRLQLGAKWPIHESNNKCSVGELFVEFIHYFANTFNYEEDAISVRTGKLIPKQVTRMYKSPKNSPADWPFLAIEEPFDRTNTARSVHDKAIFDRIMSIFKDTSKRLRQGYPFASIINKTNY
ncbi:Poly(A) RNA polymerase GLD2 [Halotydeus destructor]|nr:Poly(A) RNA polymerase GLD2 [Halotydeus destructor]